MAAEAIVYITFNLGLGFWRAADAVMMVLLPIGILRLGCKAAGYTGYTALLNEYQERVDVGTEQHNSGELNVWSNLWKSVRYPVLLASGYLLMSVMTLGYSAVWVNGSIFFLAVISSCLSTKYAIEFSTKSLLLASWNTVT